MDALNFTVVNLIPAEDTVADRVPLIQNLEEDSNEALLKFIKQELKCRSVMLITTELRKSTAQNGRVNQTINVVISLSLLHRHF